MGCDCSSRLSHTSPAPRASRAPLSPRAALRNAAARAVASEGISVRELVPPQDVLPAYARDRPGDEPGDHFLKSGQRFLEATRARGLEPHHRVLDLGCGIGRFAVALAGFLDQRGSYIGIDVSRRSIKPCRTHIGAKLPNFRFVHAGLFNTEYNPEAGAQDASDYRFPSRPESFDFVFSNSLFT